MKNWKRRLLLLFGVLIVAYLAACIYIRINQVNMIFLPLEVIYTNPGRMDMAYEDVSILSGSGSEAGELQGFWVPAEDPDAPVMLYLHGNDATIGKNLEHTERLHELGYHVLLFDYRGFGSSYGTTQPSEDKVYEDAEAAWQYLIDEKGFNPQEIFIYGHSLGGAIAIELATRMPDAAGLITECTFTSVLDMSGEKYNGWLRCLPLEWLVSHRFESIEKVGELEMPVLFIHGMADEKIPYAMSEQLHAAASEPKGLLLIPGGGHANSGSRGWIDYKKAVTEFVKQHFKVEDRSSNDSADDSKEP